MGDDRHSWEQQDNEPAIWYRRFERYRLMEPVRSIAAVFHEENSKKLEKTRKNPEPDGTWYQIAKQWQWEERALAWDAFNDAEIEQIHVAERKIILRSRYALMHKRVQELDRLAQQLLNYASDETKVWLPDVKAIGTGEFAERVDLVQFNDALFREVRACFADIAAELGERVKTTKQEVTGKNGGPLETHNASEGLTQEDLKLVVDVAAQFRKNKKKESNGDTA